MRGNVAGIVRPSWFTSSGLLGTSLSWHSSTSDFVPAGTALQANCGLRLAPNVQWVLASGAQNAYSAGIARLSVKLLLVIFMVLSFDKIEPNTTV